MLALRCSSATFDVYKSLLQTQAMMAKLAVEYTPPSPRNTPCSHAHTGEEMSQATRQSRGPSSNQGSSRRLSDRRPDARWARPGRGPVRRGGLGVGPLVHLARHVVPVLLPLSLLVSRQRRVPALARAAGCVQWPGPPPAGDEPARHLALAAPPQRHGHIPSHGRGSSSRAGSRMAMSSWSTTRPLRCSWWSSRRCGSG